MISSSEGELSIYVLSLLSVKHNAFLKNRESQLALAFLPFLFSSFFLEWNYLLSGAEQHTVTLLLATPC